MSTHYVKLTNESCCHNGFQYHEGYNHDTKKFIPDHSTNKGGLYFCEYEDFGKWIHYNDNGKMEYMWDVTIPDDVGIFRPMYRSNLKAKL